MKVLHISKYYYPQVGGIETVVQNIAEGSVKRGWETTVLCVSPNRKASIEIINGVKVIRVPSYGTLFSQPIAPGILTRAKKLAAKADLVHIHTPHPLAELNVLRGFGKKPVVISYHSDVIRQKFLLPLYNYMMTQVLKKTYEVVCSSGKIIEHSTLLSQFSEKCSVIPFGIELSRFEESAETSEKAVQLKNKHGSFTLFVGRLVSYKGVPTLISAMRDTTGKVLVVGEGPLKEELVAQAQELGVAERVVFIGKVSNDELLAYYKACDYLVLPSVTRAETFGVVMIEAMASGKPVISTWLDSGVVDVNSDRETGFIVPPSDPEALAVAMNHLSGNPGLRKEFSANALKRVQSEFTLELMIDRYVSIYEKVLGSTDKKRAA